MSHSVQESESGAALTIPTQCSSIKKGGHAVMKGHPCKVVETSTSKTGKHGHAKVHMVGIDIFTSKKYEEICPSTHTMQVPIVNRKEYQLLDISDDGFLSLMTDSGDTKEDLKVPNGDIGDNIRKAFDDGKDLLIAVVDSMGIEQAMSFKESQ
mmetsp:Transcript_250/g.669  ORF Transcript_250/g.669 Transcript_250/m.669 type:complete len:153 (-) Transcript_250:121-579(-)